MAKKVRLVLSARTRQTKVSNWIARDLWGIVAWGAGFAAMFLLIIILEDYYEDSHNH